MFGRRVSKRARMLLAIGGLATLAGTAIAWDGSTWTMPYNTTTSSTGALIGLTNSGTGFDLNCYATSTAYSTIYAQNNATSGNGSAISAATYSPSGYGLNGANAATSGTPVGVYGSTSGTGGLGVEGVNTVPSATGAGIYGYVYSGNAYGVYGSCGGNGGGTGSGVYGTGGDFGVHGVTSGFTVSAGAGVYGQEDDQSTPSSYGVWGEAKYGYGVYGSSANGYAGYFDATNAGYFNGNVSYTGSFTHVSDARFKKNIRTLPNALDTVLNLRGVTFNWRQQEFPNMHFGQGQQIGFIGQEVKRVLPELVSKDQKGYLAVDYTEVVPVLVEALRQQQQQIKGLQAQLKEINALKAHVSALSEQATLLSKRQVTTSEATVQPGS